MERYNTVCAHKTNVMLTNGMGTVIYHRTPVVHWDKDKIVLDTGGWFTNTTKLRMNQASNQYGLGYSVYQKAHQWYVEYRGQVRAFDGMMLTLEREGA